MITFPNAKINIGLQVTGKRADGYHNIETIFYPVNIKDAVEAIEASKPNFTTSGLSIPGNAIDNLCIDAYQLLKADFKIPPLHIHVHKNIPIGAGLGGGSADAAFFIKLLNEQFSLGLDDDAMINYCKKLGADCAFFIYNKSAYAYGKGDIFEKIALDLSDYNIVVVKPPVNVSTAEAYGGIKPAVSDLSLKQIAHMPIADWKHLLKNDFEINIFKQYPQIRTLKAALYDVGALFSLMSGSGSSVYGIFAQQPDLSHLEIGNQVFYC